MHVYEDYCNHPYQPPTLTSSQQQEIEEHLALMTRKGNYEITRMDIWTPLNNSSNHSYHPKTPSIAH